MALIHCTNCGHVVSDQAKACPKCGMPVCDILLYLDNENENPQQSAPEEAQPPQQEAASIDTKPKAGELAITTNIEEQEQPITEKYEIKGTLKFFGYIALAIIVITILCLIFGGGCKGSASSSGPIGDNAEKTTSEKPKNLTGKAAQYYDKAQAGDAEAQNHLGYSYQHGEGVAVDNEKAVYWFRKSAEQGNASGQNNLGFCYQFGIGVPKDINKAVEWYTKSAGQGAADGQYNLALCYDEGCGVTQDPSQAAYWFRKSAEQGYPQAQLELGLCYLEGHGMEKDEKQGVQWLQKAAEKDNPNALYFLSKCYWNGTGVPQDYEKSASYLAKAAVHGTEAFDGNNSQAQYDIAGMFFHILKEKEKSIEWYQAAARQGHPEAQQQLKEMGESW